MAAHSLQNARTNAGLLLEGDADKTFGLTGLAAGFDLDGVLSLVAEAAGGPLDGPDIWISPDAVLEAAGAAGEQLARAAAAGAAMLFATGHPDTLDLLYQALADLAVAEGASTIRPGDGIRWREPDRSHDWTVAYRGDVGAITDGRDPRHSHSPEAMQRMLSAASRLPDLVVADHGFAGAAIERGIPTIAVADVNDPALLVAQAKGRIDVVLCVDDHVAPEAYWPVFRAAAAAFSKERS